MLFWVDVQMNNLALNANFFPDSEMSKGGLLQQ